MARTLPYTPALQLALPSRKSRSSSSSVETDSLLFTSKQRCPNIDSTGGFSFVNFGGEDKKPREVFIFPITGNLTQCERDKTVKSFTAKLNKLGSLEDEKINDILSRIVDKEQTKEIWAKNLSKAVENLPADKGGKKVELAEKQPGPRLPQLESLYHVHSELNTLKVERFLNLPDRKARYLRSAAILPLAPERRVKLFRDKLLGGLKGFVSVKTLSLLKWYRKKKLELENQTESGSSKRIEVVWAHIPPTETRAAIEHWCSFLHSRGELLRLDSDPNCPEELKGQVICTVTGPDSGKGYTRLGLRIVNRPNSNSGAKTFVLGLVNMSDKNFSHHQTQKLMGFPLQTMKTIKTLNITNPPDQDLTENPRSQTTTENLVNLQSQAATGNLVNPQIQVPTDNLVNIQIQAPENLVNPQTKATPENLVNSQTQATTENPSPNLLPGCLTRQLSPGVEVGQIITF